jgi:hypothetical protein
MPKERPAAAWLVLGLTVLVGAACGGSMPESETAADAPPIPAIEVATEVAAEAVEPVEAPPPAEEAAQPDEPEPLDEPAVTLPEGFPTEPAGIEDDFREDSAAFVAATSRPQVIEFFTHW